MQGSVLVTFVLQFLFVPEVSILTSALIFKGLIWVLVCVYWFLIAAVINDQKPSCLRQYILFYGSRGQSSKIDFLGLNSRCLQSCVPAGGSRGEPVPCPFQLLEAVLGSWLLSMACSYLCFCHSISFSDCHLFSPL